MRDVMIDLKAHGRRGGEQMPTVRKSSICAMAVWAAVAFLSVAVPERSLAQAWPSSPVKVIVPYGAGGLTDIMARVTAERLSQALGQPFIIENRYGAGGAIGTQYAVRSPNDGYTLYFAAGAQVLAVPFMQKLSYDPLTQLVPISIVGFNGFVLGLNPSIPANSFSEFLSYVRANPGKVNYGIAQLGTVSHFLPAVIAAREKLEIVGVPFTSGPATMSGLIQGSVQMLIGNPTDLLPAAADRRIKLMAVSTAKRMPQVPDLPTMNETLPGFDFTAWNGYFAPAGTPRPIIDRISTELVKIGKDPAFIKRFADLGITAAGTTPEEVAAIIKRELPVYETAVKAAGLMRAAQ
jgi:tripartite-type tricarboxylate transporter receptor subunit TctC